MAEMGPADVETHLPPHPPAPTADSLPAERDEMDGIRRIAERTATAGYVLKYGILFAVLGAVLAFYQVADYTFRYVLDKDAPFSAAAALADTAPIPRALLWGTASQAICWRLAALTPAATLALGIAVWSVGAYGLLRALNTSFRLTSGIDWNMGVLTHTYMHTPPLIKAFLIAITAAVPAIAVWISLGLALGGGPFSIWLRMAVLGALGWALFSQQGIAGDYESGNYELPRDRRVLYSLLARGALAGTIAALVARLAPAVAPDGLFQFYAGMGGIGEPAWRSITLLTCGMAAACGFAFGGLAAALAAARGSPAARLRASALPLISLVAAIVAAGTAPYALAHRYDFRGSLTALAPNGVSVGANRLAQAAGIHVGPSGFSTVMLVRPGQTTAVNVARQSIDGLDASTPAAARIQAFLEGRRYQTALSDVAFRTWYDSACLAWDSAECLRVIHTNLTRCPSPAFVALYGQKLRSAAATSDTLHYADLLADESRFAFLTRESRESMGDIYARLGARDKAAAWYRRAEVPESRIPELLAARVMFADGRLSGRILVNGVPSQGVHVGLVPAASVHEAFETSLAPGLIRPFWLRWVGTAGRTDAQGRFRLNHIVAGSYRLVLSTPLVRLPPFSRDIRVDFKTPADYLFIGYGRKTLDMGDISITAPPPIQPAPDRSLLL